MNKDAHNQRLQASGQKLKEQSHKLRERLKELSCLHDISKTINTRETMEEILQDVVNIIPPAMQYPQISCSKIILWDKEYKTENRKDCQWKLSSDIRVNKKIAGKIEVGYLEKKPESDIGPFFNEERNLLDTIADQLGIVIEKKQANKELTKQNSFLNNVIESLTYPFFVIDVNDYSILQANTASGYIPGSDKTTCHALSHNSNVPCNTQAHRCPLNDVIKTRQPVMYEHIHFDKDGNEIIVEVHGSPVIDENGDINSIIEYSIEITGRKRAEEKLKLAKEKAEESDRLKSAFLATMNHELRTPLNHVLGISGMIPDMTDDESIKEFAGLIQESGLNLLNIIEDIFDLSMIEQTEIRIREDEVFIRDIYTELKKQLQEVLGESNKGDNIQLNYKIDSNIATGKIITDKPKIMQVMSNIIKNAVKYTNNGEISLSLMLAEGNYLYIKVKDTGIGISKEKLQVIFESFRQGDDSHTRKYDGIGIGLTISQQIADAMGGTIKVESEPDMGSAFTFSVPVTINEENMINSPKEDASFTVPDLSGKSLLVVEDDTIGMEMVVNMLKPSKCKIINAVNGQEAVDAVKTNPDIDIILMDLKMPGMDGFEATKTIRKDFSDLPIIAFTAYSLQKDKKRALDAGCNDIITKPISKEIMFKKLQDFLVK